MDSVEKIYCTGHDNNDALIAALANHNNDPMAMAAMMNNQNQWGNNPFAYLIWLVFAMRMWNNNGEGNLQNNAIQSQLDSLRSQMSDNQNSNLIIDAVKGNETAIGQLANNLNCDFNTLSNAICSVRSGVQEVAGQVGFSAERVINAINLGDANLTSALQSCCCQTQQNIIKMGYESQLGQKDIVNTIQTQTLAMQQGHSNITTEILRNLATITAQNQQDKCDILRSGELNTQRIVDVLNNHWTADLQQRYNDARLELSQLRQNETLISALKTTTTTTA